MTRLNPGWLVALFAAILSAAVIGESPQAFHAVAFGLIVGGIFVSSRTRAQPPRPR